MQILPLINQHICNPYVIDKRGRLSHYPAEASIISRVDGNVIGKCHRAVYYEWKGEKATNPVDARGMWTFAMGKMIEAGYIEYCKQLGIWAGSNIHLYDAIHNISGEADLFVWDRGQDGTKQLIGVEIKTAYGYGFQKSVLQFPKIENLLQSALYLDYFRDKVKEWHLIYKARDTQEDIEYILTLDKDSEGEFLVVNYSIPVHVFYLHDIYKRYDIMGGYMLRNELAPRDYIYGYSLEESKDRLERGIISKTKYKMVENEKVTDSDWQCLYCKFLDLCWAEKRALIKTKGGLNGTEETNTAETLT